MHVLDLSRAIGDENVVDSAKLHEDYNVIRKELEDYSPTLAEKKEIVVLNKVDLVSEENLSATISELQKKGLDVFASISSATTHGTDQLMSDLLPIVLEEREAKAVEQNDDELTVLTPHLDSSKMGAYRVEKAKDKITVLGKRIEQLAVMTDFSSEGGVKRLRDVLQKIGLLKMLEKESEENGLEIYVGEIEITEYV